MKKEQITIGLLLNTRSIVQFMRNVNAVLSIIVGKVSAWKMGHGV